MKKNSRIKQRLIPIQISFKRCSKNVCICMIRFEPHTVDVSCQKSDKLCSLKGTKMIEVNKKYRLKKINGWFEKDSEEFLVVGFYENELVACISPESEKYVFRKEFLIDPEKSNEIYSDIQIIRG